MKEQRFGRYVGVLVVAGVVLGSCDRSSSDASKASERTEAAPNPSAQPAPAAPMPTPVALGSTAPKPPDKARFIEVTPDKVQQGKALFGTCVGCHDTDASGKLGMGPRIASESYLAAATDDFLVTTIKNGRAGTTMIPWEPVLGEEKILAIVAYLRSLHPVAPAELDYRAATGDAESGAQIFRSICSGCHGRNGAGYMETANGTGIGRKAFLDSAPDGFIRYIVKHGKTLTAMRGFDESIPTAIANLDDQQVDDTIAYLRKSAW